LHSVEEGKNWSRFCFGKPTTSMDCKNAFYPQKDKMFFFLDMPGLLRFYAAILK